MPTSPVSPCCGTAHQDLWGLRGACCKEVFGLSIGNEHWKQSIPNHAMATTHEKQEIWTQTHLHEAPATQSDALEHAEDTEQDCAHAWHIVCQALAAGGA